MYGKFLQLLDCAFCLFGQDLSPNQTIIVSSGGWCYKNLGGCHHYSQVRSYLSFNNVIKNSENRFISFAMILLANKYSSSTHILHAWVYFNFLVSPEEVLIDETSFKIPVLV